MITRERFDELLDMLCGELPECFFEHLNGGVIVLGEAKPHPKARGDDLYILGEYRHSRDMGRSIAIFYGSFMRLYGYASEEALIVQMRKTLRHEFRHHLEDLGGERTLAEEDEFRLGRYLSGGN